MITCPFSRLLKTSVMLKMSLEISSLPIGKKHPFFFPYFHGIHILMMSANNSDILLGEMYLLNTVPLWESLINILR